jgi:hypothetical protein
MLASSPLGRPLRSSKAIVDELEFNRTLVAKIGLTPE